MNSLIKQFLYILGISILFGFIRYFSLTDYHLIDSNDQSKDYDLHTVSGNPKLSIAPPGARFLSIERAKGMYDNSSGIFIDARYPDEFDEGHILNALNIPYENLNDYEYEDILDSLAISVAVTEDSVFVDGWVENFLVVYCSGEGCSLSEDWAYQMSEYGPFHEDITIFHFDEGFPVWKDLGYPIKISDLDISKRTTDHQKPFLNFIDYIVIFSILLIFIFYFNDAYKHFIPSISRLVLGFIFIYFSWDKILDPKLFANMIRNYDIIPFGFENLIALILPYVEFMVGTFLVLGVFLDISAIVSTALLVMFILMIGQAYLRGKSIDCGCLLSDLSDSSSSEKRVYMIKRIIQDICFILYALIVKYRVIFKRNK